jgi:hypothetical protein
VLKRDAPSPYNVLHIQAVAQLFIIHILRQIIKDFA